MATLPSSCATMLRHFCGPIPGSRRRKRSSFRTIASAMSAIGATSARAATSGPTSFTVMSRSKNSRSTSRANPISTGRGWSRVAW